MNNIQAKQHPTVQLCPFCTFFGEETEPVGDDFFGTPAAIGDVRCCKGCYGAITTTNNEQEMLSWYHEQQKQAAHTNYQEVVEQLTPEERENLRNFWHSVALQFEKENELAGKYPIGDEYCWMHVDQPDGGGWCCGVCYREQQEVK